MRRLLLLATVCLATACACTPPPQAAVAPSADPGVTRGLALAQEVCATCHAVTPGHASPNPAAPRFEAVARMPGMNTMALNVWLHSAHPTMPNIDVTPAQARDLAAYLETLKGDGARG